MLRTGNELECSCGKGRNLSLSLFLSLMLSVSLFPLVCMGEEESEREREREWAEVVSNRVYRINTNNHREKYHERDTRRPSQNLESIFWLETNF